MFLSAFAHQPHIAFSFSDSVKMAYAGDRMYNEVIRKKMADLATKVKAKEIIAHLPCLTISDRVMLYKARFQDLCPELLFIC